MKLFLKHHFQVKLFRCKFPAWDTIIKMIRFLNDDDFSIRRTGGICRPTNPQVTLGIGMQTRETTSLSRSSSVFDAY